MYLRITHVHLQPQLLLGLYSDQWPLAATSTRHCVIGYASSIPCIVANCHLNDVNGCGHFMLHHDDAVTRKRFPDYWPRVRVNHRPLTDSPPQSVFSMLLFWTNWWKVVLVTSVYMMSLIGIAAWCHPLKQKCYHLYYIFATAAPKVVNLTNVVLSSDENVIRMILFHLPKRC